MVSRLLNTATELVGQVKGGEVSALELVDESLARIGATDEVLQAFISVDPDGARSCARALDSEIRSGPIGPLHGLPIAVKDVTDVAGMVTTQGSSLNSRTPAKRDSSSVAKLRASGAIVIGKTNTPEFSFGAVCTNTLRGPTRNPWDLGCTSGGSSGGSAVAVATGTVPLAQGTDFGGSVRTPASFTGCVGYRPTPGLIPDPDRALAWDTLSTQGVLARSVDDAALMASVMTGPDPYDPMSQCAVPDRRSYPQPPRVAASATLGGAYRIESAVRSRFNRALNAARTVFPEIMEDAPPTDGASEAFCTLRAAQNWFQYQEIVTTHSAQLSDTFVWNVRQGQDITAEQYLRAQAIRSRTHRAFVDFFRKYDVLILPSASVLPFSNERGEVTEIDDTPCSSIIEYLNCTYLISLAGCPAISIPAPIVPGEIPFGVQLVAAPHQDQLLLDVAHDLEAGAGFSHRWPGPLHTTTLIQD